MIITSQEQYTNLLERLNREQSILTPIFRDSHYHERENIILCVGIAFEDHTYVISNSHPDALKFPIPNCTFTNEDINTLAFVRSDTLRDFVYPPYVHDTLNLFGEIIDANRLVPLTVWSNILTEHGKWQWDILKKYPLNQTFEVIRQHIKTLRDIEKAGMCVNRHLLIEHFGQKARRAFKGNMIYSQYNPYTTTGRPSNRFGGINFAALNKSDGTRDMFISRYDGGVLVQMDFEAYHLRLVADDLGFPLPKHSIHTELAKRYFKTNDITEEMYAASKQKTFQIMYGMSDETYGIELFEHLVDIRRRHKDATGTFVLPSGLSVEFTESNPSKMFNYHVQSLEVVKTLPKLQKVLDLIKNTRNHLILYTYDSILLDMEQFDQAVIEEIVTILEENGKFPVRVYAGTTYGNITEIRL